MQKALNDLEIEALNTVIHELTHDGVVSFEKDLVLRLENLYQKIAYNKNEATAEFYEADRCKHEEGTFIDGITIRCKNCDNIAGYTE